MSSEAMMTLLSEEIKKQTGMEPHELMDKLGVKDWEELIKLIMKADAGQASPE